MIYGGCFLVSVGILIWVIAHVSDFRVTEAMLAVVTTVGNGGYYALSRAKCLEEAILANKLIYLIGIFLPFFSFILICELCKKALNASIVGILLIIQVIIYFSVCTIGENSLFYTDVSFYMGPMGGYLVKSYGPLHTVYLVTLCAYLLGNIAVMFVNMVRENVVSASTSEYIIASNMILLVCYGVERAIKLNIELMPIIFTVSLLLYLHPIVKLHKYAIGDNYNIVRDKLDESGYIVFSNRLNYMNCNDKARELFPELNDWKLEKRIPGNGGRFNTFLRQPLMRYVEGAELDNATGNNFNLDNQTFHVIIRDLYVNNLKKNRCGYIIEIENVTHIVSEQ